MKVDPEDLENEDTEDLENEDTEEFEEESVAELCRTPLLKHKHNNKITERVMDGFIDRWRRDIARKTASIQDAARHHVNSTRYDVNSYAGGPTTIADLCVVEKRKVR